MTYPDDEHKRLEELQEAIAVTKVVAPKLIEKGRNLTEAGQSALDWASALEVVAKNSPDGFFKASIFDPVSRGIGEFNSVATSQYDAITADKKLMLLAHANASTIAVSTSAAALDAIQMVKVAAIPELKPLFTLLHRTADANAVKLSMKSLGLDMPLGQTRSPLQLLEAAETALRRPFADEGYATAVLVPLREAIQNVIDELLKRRVLTEKTGGWKSKVLSIGHTLGSAAISAGFVERIATTTHTLVDQLSGGKDRDMSREHIFALFDQGVSLLQDIFAMIEQEKLR